MFTGIALQKRAARELMWIMNTVGEDVPYERRLQTTEEHSESFLPVGVDDSRAHIAIRMFR